ncbi:MAG: zinc ABC transporter substrate-binding protein [Maritimibacter sp.]|nr:zinc ABC transporter substrate-binding protein [Maritimibacter sp.]
MRFPFALLPNMIAGPIAGLIAGLIAGPALAEPPRVVADIAPVHALLSQVMEGVATPDLLLEQNADPHAVQLRPSQARMLAGADLFVWVGPELSPWLAGIVESEVAEDIALTAHPATHLRELGEAGTDHAEEAHGDAADHDDDTAAPDHDDHGEADEAQAEDAGHDHAHTGVDPHVWLSTENARAWLGVFAETLAARDPENAAAYRANAGEAVAELDALDARIGGRLAAHQGAEIVTFHAAFGYFTEEFGIEVAGSVRPGDASAPSAAALDALRDLVADHGVECAFAEPAYDPGLLDAIAGGTGLRIGTLDATGSAQPQGPGQYAATLEGIAVAIAECLEAG